jgi:hypothetical protein
MLASLISTFQFQFFPDDVHSPFSTECFYDFSCFDHPVPLLDPNVVSGLAVEGWGDLLSFTIILFWSILQVIFFVLLFIDIIDTGFIRWIKMGTSWLEMIFIALLCSGAVNSPQLVWTIIAGLVTFAVFLSRLYSSCSGQLALAPFPDSNISRLKSCHFVFVNRTFDDMQWFFDDLQEIVASDEYGFLSCELYFSRENEESMQLRLSENAFVTNGSGRVQMQLRRPQWEAIFSNLVHSRYDGSSTPPVVGLFFCGNVSMGRAINAAAQLSSTNEKNGGARFIFKMENF